MTASEKISKLLAEQARLHKVNVENMRVLQASRDKFVASRVELEDSLTRLRNGLREEQHRRVRDIKRRSKAREERLMLQMGSTRRELQRLEADYVHQASACSAADMVALMKQLEASLAQQTDELTQLRTKRDADIDHVNDEVRKRLTNAERDYKEQLEALRFARREALNTYHERTATNRDSIQRCHRSLMKLQNQIEKDGEKLP